MATQKTVGRDYPLSPTPTPTPVVTGTVTTNPVGDKLAGRGIVNIPVPMAGRAIVNKGQM